MNKENLIKLKELLETEESINKTVRELKEKFMKDNETIFKVQEDIKAQIEYCKDIARENAEAGFAKDGEKKRLGGIGIRVMTQLDYNDDEAFVWAKEHDMALSLDKVAFKKIAKIQDLDFVTKSEKVTVTFPKVIGELE